MNEDRFGTPLWLFARIEQAFGRVHLDAAAEPWSALTERFITKQQNVFRIRTHAAHAFGNWPYGRGQLLQFVPHARQMVLDATWESCTQLVPHYTDTEWFQRAIAPEGKALACEWRYGWLAEPLEQWTRYVSEGLVTDVISISRRLEHRFPPRYAGAREVARFPSALLRFTRPVQALRLVTHASEQAKNPEGEFAQLQEGQVRQPGRAPEAGAGAARVPPRARGADDGQGADHHRALAGFEESGGSRAGRERLAQQDPP